MSAPSTIGRYRLLAEVGRGAFGVVYRACDPQGRPVALKLFRLGAGTERQQRRFKLEVQALLRIRHPHVVGLLDAGTVHGGGSPYLVLEWVEGETLQERLTRTGAFPWRDALELMQRLTDAMAFCHTQGVVHRDIKPANVLLRRRDGAPLLADFGLAKASLDGASLAPAGARTAEGAPLGTPGFWAPEQARGEVDQVGPASDVYGLGATLYAMLTGRSPHQSREVVSVFEALERLPDPPSRLVPGIPPALDALCLRCLEPQPARRYPDARALAAALAVCVESPRTVPGRRRAWLLPLLAALTLLVLGSAVWLARRGPSTPPTAALPPVAPLEPPSATDPIPAPRDAAPLEPPPTPPPPPPPPVDPIRRREADDLYRRSWELHQQGDLNGALGALERALELDPGRGELWSTRAALRSEAGDLVGAERDLDRALELDQGLPDIWRNRGIVKAMQGGLEESEADFTRALEIDPYHVPSLRDRAVTRLKLGNPQGSQEDLNRALQLAPDDPDLLYNRALARIDMGDQRGARADLDEAEGGHHDRARLLKVRANVRLGLDDLEGARADCEAAMAMGSPPADLLATRGHVRLRQGDARGALEDCAAAEAKDPLTMGLGEVKAGAHLALEEWTAARQVCDDTLRRDPQDPFAWYGRGMALHELGDAEGARASLSRFLQLAPEHRQAEVAKRLLLQLGAGAR